jgi:putative hydrolase of the HAD superfamily
VPNDPPLRAIAFDLFHTLVDPQEFQPRGFRRSRAVADLVGLPAEEVLRAWEGPQYRDRQITRVPTVVDRVRALCDARGVTPPASVWPEVDDLLGRYQDLAIRHPRPEVVEALRGLRGRGWTLGVVSNCDERESRAWPGSELSRLVDGSVLSCDVGFAKPDPEAYRALVHRWGDTPLSAAIFVGDGYSDELPGARRAGFGRVLFQSGFVSVNGIRTAEENARIAAGADGSIAGIGELLRLPAPPR